MLRRRNLFQERYNFFFSELKNEILSGGLKPGEFILPENTLSDKYKISRVSVRKALAQFVEEGLIEKIAGKGNRVKPPVEHMVRQTMKLIWPSRTSERDVLRTIIKRYEASYPYVKVELHELPAQTYAAKLIELIEDGAGPDLFFISDAHMRHLIEHGKLNVFEPYMPPKLDPDKDSYAKLFQLFTVDGTLLSVPIHFSPVVICCNKQLFAQAGISADAALNSWDDLLAIAKACTAQPNASGIVELYGFCFSSSINRWPAFILQNGGMFKSADGSRSVFTDERNVEAMRFCSDLLYKHRVSPIYSHASSDLAEQSFKKKRCAMIISTYYMMNEFRHADISWDVLPVPGNRRKATLLLGGSLGISKYSDKVKAAQSFIDFVVGEEAQTMLKQAGCAIPALRSAAENDTLLRPNVHPEHYNAFIEAVECSYTHRELGITNADGAIMYDELHTLWANMEEPEQVCRRIEERTNRLPEETIPAIP